MSLLHTLPFPGVYSGGSPSRCVDVTGGMPVKHKTGSQSAGQTMPAAAAAAAPVHMQRALMGKQMLDMVDGFGRAPLHVAAAAGRVDVVQQLLFGGCDYTKALQADFRWVIITTQLPLLFRCECQGACL